MRPKHVLQGSPERQTCYYLLTDKQRQEETNPKGEEIVARDMKKGRSKKAQDGSMYSLTLPSRDQVRQTRTSRMLKFPAVWHGPASCSTILPEGDMAGSRHETDSMYVSSLVCVNPRSSRGISNIRPSNRHDRTVRDRRPNQPARDQRAAWKASTCVPSRANLLMTMHSVVYIHPLALEMKLSDRSRLEKQRQRISANP